MTHPDIGKRVRWEFCENEGEGILMAVNCDTSFNPHLVKVLFGVSGWTFNPIENSSCCNEAIKQGVTRGTQNLYWVSSYEVIEEEKPKCECGKVVGAFGIRPLCHYHTECLENYFGQPKPKKTFMSDIVQKLKNLTLSPTDRILRKHGLEDECGKLSDEAYRMMDRELNEELWKSRREAIAADLMKLEAEEKKL